MIKLKKIERFTVLTKTGKVLANLTPDKKFKDCDFIISVQGRDDDDRGVTRFLAKILVKKQRKL